MLGKGRFTPYTDADLARLADRHGWHPATLESLAITESGGSGRFGDGRMKILPEPHKFYAQLPSEDLQHRALQIGFATRSYEETKRSGHYKKMTAQAGPRYALLERWIKFDRKAAFEAISMGVFQIMGFNFAMCGFASAEAMFDAFVDSEFAQLKAFATFLIKSGLKSAVRDRKFEKIEDIYNGGGIGTYSDRMAREDKRLRAGKWKNYQPGGMAKAAPAPKPEPGPLVLRKGDSGEAVEAYQHRLVAHDFDVQPDGLFGTLTEGAVKNFQLARGLKVDGVIGPVTAEALDAQPTPAAAPAAKPKDKPAVIVDDQPAPALPPNRLAQAIIALLVASAGGLAWVGNVPCVVAGVLCG